MLIFLIAINLKFNAGTKIMRTSSANGEHKHSEIERFSMLNGVCQSHNRQNSKDSVTVIVNKFSDLH